MNKPDWLDEFLDKQWIEPQPPQWGFKLLIEAGDKHSQKTAREMVRALRGWWDGTRWKVWVLALILAIWREWTAQFAKTPAWKNRFATTIGYEPQSIIDLFNTTREENLAAIRWPWQDYESYNALSNATGRVGINRDGNNFELPSSNDRYFQEYRQLAIEEAWFGICPSITLMQGKIETWAKIKDGKRWISPLAQNGNHFGMKQWTYTTIVQAWKWLRSYIQYAPKQDQMYIQALINHIDLVMKDITGSSKHFDDGPNESFVNFKTAKGSYAAHTILLLMGTKPRINTQAKWVVPIQWRYLKLLSCNDFDCQAIAISSGWYATEESYHLNCIAWIKKSWIWSLDKVVDRNRARAIEMAIMRYYAWLSPPK